MKETVLETPKPYGWMIEGTPLIWRGEYAIADAKSYGRNWKDEPEPIPLYREPPAHHFANAGNVMPIGTARELLSCAALEILGLKPSTKLYTMPEEHEPPVTEKSSAAQSERKWNELSPNDILAAVSISLLNSYEHPNRLLDFARFLELVLKEKNT
jgi:hypothetical protein